MIQIHKDDHCLTIHMDSSHCARLPNRLIWDINTFLSTEFTLQEWRIEKKPSGTNDIPIGNRFLCFYALGDFMFHGEDVSPEEVQAAYSAQKEHISSYDEFAEIWEMEMIDDITYLAIENVPSFERELSSALQQMHICRKSKIQQALSKTTAAQIHIADHSFLEIHSSNDALLSKIITIAEEVISI